jgi:hypothetical protein
LRDACLIDSQMSVTVTQACNIRSSLDVSGGVTLTIGSAAVCNFTAMNDWVCPTFGITSPSVSAVENKLINNGVIRVFGPREYIDEAAPVSVATASFTNNGSVIVNAAAFIIDTSRCFTNQGSISSSSIAIVSIRNPCSSGSSSSTGGGSSGGSDGSSSDGHGSGGRGSNGSPTSAGPSVTSFVAITLMSLMMIPMLPL